MYSCPADLDSFQTVTIHLYISCCGVATHNSSVDKQHKPFVWGPRFGNVLSEDEPKTFGSNVGSLDSKCPLKIRAYQYYNNRNKIIPNSLMTPFFYLIFTFIFTGVSLAFKTETIIG